MYYGDHSKSKKIVFIWQSKFGTFSGKLVSVWGLCPQTSTGALTLDPAVPLGDSVPQTPSDLLPPGKIPSYATDYYVACCPREKKNF